jgi:alcohol dehydrogenase class IV
MFGAGSLADVGKAVAAFACNRAVVLSTRGQSALADRVAKALGGRRAGVFAGAVMHTPVEVTETALQHLRQAGGDCIIAVGGGSAIGLGKALALRTDLPQIAIPTTYAGSEMTDILGETSGGAKTTQRSSRILPECVIYDPELTLSLPVPVSVTSGFNAMAHAVEALYATDSNPVTCLMAEEGIRAISTALVRISCTPADLPSRTGAMIGAWLCGMCLGNSAMALHHKLCHVLGGTFNLPHAETHTVLLPHAVAFNAAHASQAMAVVARALEAPAAAGLYDLAARLGAPLALKDIGMPQSGLDRAAEIAVANPYPNPRPLERAAIRALLDDAFHGHKPSSDT